MEYLSQGNNGEAKVKVWIISSSCLLLHTSWATSSVVKYRYTRLQIAYLGAGLCM